MYGLLGYDNIWLRYNYLNIWNLRVQKIIKWLKKFIFLTHKMYCWLLLQIYCTTYDWFCGAGSHMYILIYPNYKLQQFKQVLVISPTTTNIKKLQHIILRGFWSITFCTVDKYFQEVC